MNLQNQTALYPLHMMLHPIDASDGIKWQKKGSYIVSAALVVLAFLTAVLERQATGFIFNPHRLDRINIINILLVTFAMAALWIIANRALTTLMDGEGRTSEIIIGSCYSLLPYIAMTLFTVVLSHFLTHDMAVFLTYIKVGGYIWSGMVIFQVMRVIHQFSVKQTLWNLALTVVGMMIIAFIILLIYSLFQQVYVFLFTIFNEIMFRM